MTIYAYYVFDIHQSRLEKMKKKDFKEYSFCVAGAASRLVLSD